MDQLRDGYDDLTPHLLNLGEFILSSGGRSSLKIDCDALTDSDIECCAALLKSLCGSYGSVGGVPRGGVRLATAMRSGASQGPLLVTEDCLTTGGSVARHIDKLRAYGVDTVGAKVATIFKRRDTQPILAQYKVFHLFQFNHWLEDA